jgi:hypothetical protein
LMMAFVAAARELTTIFVTFIVLRRELHRRNCPYFCLLTSAF